MELLYTAPVISLAYAFLGGAVPAMAWLYFLLREDSRCPEPPPLLFIAFVTGALAVPLALPLEALWRDYTDAAFAACRAGTLCLPVIAGWSVIEESLKYGLAAAMVLWRPEVDEPIDTVIYILTVALGFAALENVLFLLAPFASGDLLGGLETGNLRFIGSTLLHVMASSVIGFALAFTFRARRSVRVLAAGVGLILAIALHAVFNFFIILEDGAHTLFAFMLVWVAAVVFLALTELVRYFWYRDLPANTCLPN